MITREEIKYYIVVIIICTRRLRRKKCVSLSHKFHRKRWERGAKKSGENILVRLMFTCLPRWGGHTKKNRTIWKTLLISLLRIVSFFRRFVSFRFLLVVFWFGCSIKIIIKYFSSVDGLRDRRGTGGCTATKKNNLLKYFWRKRRKHFFYF